MMVALDLDEHCGQYFTYRDLIECGETWAALAQGRVLDAPGVDNRPRTVETVAAMRALCATILDPVRAHFGDLRLTYAFASRALTAHIKGRIAPSLDQHAGHEISPNGRPICARLGLAADFHVPGVNSRDVALWIYDNTAFDRLYFYGDDRPVHVSCSLAQTRQLVHLQSTPRGGRVPRVVSRAFLVGKPT